MTEKPKLTKKTVEQRRRKIRQEINEEKERHRENMVSLHVKLMRLQARCPHPHECISFYVDPAGGNDSNRECSVCGKEFGYKRA